MRPPATRLLRRILLSIGLILIGLELGMAVLQRAEGAGTAWQGALVALAFVPFSVVGALVASPANAVGWTFLGLGVTSGLNRLAEAWVEEGQLAFSVKDEGPGFDLEKVKLGSGLQNMADRVEALGGVFETASSPGKGTIVAGRLPAKRLAGARE